MLANSGSRHNAGGLLRRGDHVPPRPIGYPRHLYDGMFVLLYSRSWLAVEVLTDVSQSRSIMWLGGASEKARFPSSF